MNKENKNKNLKNYTNQINIYKSNGSGIEKNVPTKNENKTTSNQELYYVEDLDKNYDQSYENTENL